MNAAQTHLSNVDPVLAEAIDTLPLPVVESSQDVFFDLCTCILEQQIHYRAKGVYLKKFLALTQDQLPTPALLLGLNAQEFAQHKIAGNKFKALQHLAQHWQQAQLDQTDWFGLTDEAVRQRLLPIKGIGPWTVEMVLLYTLGRPDIFHPDDFQLKKIMAQCYGLANDKGLQAAMLAVAKGWQPYRSTAVLYLLAWKDYLKKR